MWIFVVWGKNSFNVILYCINVFIGFLMKNGSMVSDMSSLDVMVGMMWNVIDQ